MRISLKSKHVVVGCLALLAGMAGAETFSNTRDSTLRSFGQPGTTSFGQVFATAGGTLTDWTFYAYQGNAGKLSLVIANWDGSRATGPALYQSSVFSYAGGRQALEFGNINHSFSAGSYIAYLTVAGISGAASQVALGGSASNGGMTGSFYQLNSNGVDPLTLSTNWSGGNPGRNMQYTANFVSSVPEPESQAMMLAGLCVLGAVARRKSRNQTGRSFT